MYVTTQIQVTPFTTKPVTIFVHSIFHIENVSYTKQTRKKEKKKKTKVKIVTIAQAAEFWRVYQAFRRHHLRGSSQALQRLHELLYAYGNASATGIINKRRRWDFPGSFHFVGTIVSTIGEWLCFFSVWIVCPKVLKK